VNVALNIVLVIAILGYFGFETTSFAALVAAMGIAIGAAWAGLLANFRGRVSDRAAASRSATISGRWHRGHREGDRALRPTMLTPDNVTAFVGNNKILADNIHNYSSSPYRRVDRLAQLAHSVDASDAIRRLKEALARIPNVNEAPPPDVEIVDFNERGAILAVRPYTHTDHYWQVYFDTNKAISDTFGAAGYPVPETRMRVHQTV
jgi:small conductance mechanosensitive channel